MGKMPNSDEIRLLVREAVRSIAPDASATSGALSQPQASGQGVDIAAQIRADLGRTGESLIPVQVGSNFDLNLFVGRILSLADAADIRNAMAQGKVRFVMGAENAIHGDGATTGRTSGGGGTYIIEKGVLNETKIAEIAKSHTRVELGHAAVLTPLAKDRARELKIELIRRRS